MIRVLKYLFLFVLISYGCLYYLGSGRIGEDLVSGPVASDPVPPEQLERRDLAQRAATDRAQPAATRQILFGDLHVHSTISTDAFQASMSMYGGNGANPVSDACDFARYCSALDFWSINDHAISITPKRWRETKNAIESCNAVAGAGDNPDMVAFLGWEWTQIGTDPSNHYGHKNVILKSGDMNKAPIRPISAGYPPGTDSISSIPTAALGLLPFVLGFGADTHNYITYLQETLSTSDCPPNPGVMDCRQVARTPDALFSQLDEWGGDAMVIPHGSTWGFYTPPGSSWEKQLNSQQHDPKRQKLVEVFSGHGNSEEYRSWREVSWDAEGNPVCPEASDNYLPSCQRAGDIIQQRCLDGGAQAADCAQHATEARLNYVAAGTEGFLTVPGAKPADWLDAGQCSD